MCCKQQKQEGRNSLKDHRAVNFQQQNPLHVVLEEDSRVQVVVSSFVAAAVANP